MYKYCIYLSEASPAHLFCFVYVVDFFPPQLFLHLLNLEISQDLSSKTQFLKS